MNIDPVHNGLDPALSLGEAPSLPLRYEVFVGHTRIQVEGTDIPDAIGQARRRLCQEMPRLWDVIQALQVDKFQVRPLP